VVHISTLPDDPLWPRAGHWIAPVAALTSDAAETTPASPRCHLGLLGVPAFRTSITPTGANATPGAIRDALLRYSTYSVSRGVDVSSLRACDFGDVAEPDGDDGEQRTRDAVAAVAAGGCELLVALGGDNSITFPVMRGLLGEEWERAGLVTIDAHHDLRDGTSNGSPVRRLIEAGLPGERVAQVGIGDFSNSAAYARRALELGVTVISRAELRTRSLGELIGYALARAGSAGGPVFVDIDVDVCDRSVVPGCPSAAPGGLSADELREIAFLVASDPRVRGIDITEIDATADTADQRTVRLAALLVLEAAAGLCVRLGVS